MKRNFKQKYLMALLGVMASSVVVGSVNSNDVGAMGVLSEQDLSKIDSKGQTSELGTNQESGRPTSNPTFVQGGSSSSSQGGAPKSEAPKKESGALTQSSDKNPKDASKTTKTTKAVKTTKPSENEGKDKGKNSSKRKSKSKRKRSKNKKIVKSTNGKTSEKEGANLIPVSTNNLQSGLKAANTMATNAAANQKMQPTNLGVATTPANLGAVSGALALNEADAKMAMRYIEAIDNLAMVGQRVASDVDVKFVVDDANADNLKRVDSNVLAGVLEKFKMLLYGQPEFKAGGDSEPRGGIEFKKLPLPEDVIVSYAGLLKSTLQNSSIPIQGSQGRIVNCIKILMDMRKSVVNAAKNNLELPEEVRNKIETYVSKYDRDFFANQESFDSTLHALDENENYESIEFQVNKGSVEEAIIHKIVTDQMEYKLKTIDFKHFIEIVKMFNRSLGQGVIGKICAWIRANVHAKKYQRMQEGEWFWNEGNDRTQVASQRSFITDLVEEVKKAYKENLAELRKNDVLFQTEAPLQDIVAIIESFKGMESESSNRVVLCSADDLIRIFEASLAPPAVTLRGPLEGGVDFTTMQKNQLNWLVEFLSKLYADEGVTADFLTDVFTKESEAGKAVDSFAKVKKDFVTQLGTVKETLKDDDYRVYGALNKIHEIMSKDRFSEETDFSDDFKRAMSVLVDESGKMNSKVKEKFGTNIMDLLNVEYKSVNKVGFYTKENYNELYSKYEQFSKILDFCSSQLTDVSSTAAILNTPKAGVLNLLWLTSILHEKYAQTEAEAVTNKVVLNHDVDDFSNIDNAGGVFDEEHYTMSIAKFLETISTNFGHIKTAFESADEGGKWLVLSKASDKLKMMSYHLGKIYSFLKLMSLNAYNLGKNDEEFNKYFAENVLDDYGEIRLSSEVLKKLFATLPPKYRYWTVGDTLTNYVISCLKLAVMMTNGFNAANVVLDTTAAFFRHSFGVDGAATRSTCGGAHIGFAATNAVKSINARSGEFPISTQTGIGAVGTPALPGDTGQGPLGLIKSLLTKENYAAGAAGKSLYELNTADLAGATTKFSEYVQQLVTQGNYWEFFRLMQIYILAAVGSTALAITDDKFYFGFVNSSDALGGNSTNITGMDAVVAQVYSSGATKIDDTTLARNFSVPKKADTSAVDLLGWSRATFVANWLSDYKKLFKVYLSGMIDKSFNPGLDVKTSTIHASDTRNHFKGTSNIQTASLNLLFNLPFLVGRSLDKNEAGNVFGVSKNQQVSVHASALAAPPDAVSVPVSALWSYFSKGSTASNVKDIVDAADFGFVPAADKPGYWNRPFNNNLDSFLDRRDELKRPSYQKSSMLELIDDSGNGLQGVLNGAMMNYSQFGGVAPGFGNMYGKTVNMLEPYINPYVNPYYFM